MPTSAHVLESLPMRLGGRGGTQAESREPRLQRLAPLTLPDRSSIPPLQLPEPCPAPHLEQLPGEVAAFVEALQVPNEVSAGHALPDVLREGTEACESGWLLKSLNRVCVLGSFPPDPTHVAMEIGVQ